MPGLSVGSQLLSFVNDTISTTFLPLFLVLQPPKATMHLAAVVFTIMTDGVSDSLPK